MKALVIVALIALSFTTGFTCSKNSPEQAPAASAPAQEQMAQPAPAEGQAPAAGEQQPGAAAAPSTEAAPATPPTPPSETK